MSEKGAFRQHSVIYTYDIHKLKNVDKVRFVYLLKGRKSGDGMVKKMNGRFLANGCFVVPISKANEIENVFKQWKVSYEKDEVLMK